jgi:hypothetical protein
VGHRKNKGIKSPWGGTTLCLRHGGESRMALRYYTNIATCSAIADAFDSASHGPLTRMLQGTWSGHTLLHLALGALFPVAGGYLLRDDTVVAKPYARLLGEAAWGIGNVHAAVVCTPSDEIDSAWAFHIV